MKNLLKDNLIFKKTLLFMLEVNLKVKTFIGTKSKKCEQCNFKAPNNSCLSFHVKILHEKKATFNCTQCSFVCYSKNRLKAHIDAVHEKKRPHKCEYCEGAFFLRRDKERHLLKFHNIDVKKGGGGGLM